MTETTTASHRPIVGLIGRKRAGKDSFAARLVEAHGYRRHAFADRLRDALLALDPIVDVDHWNDSEDRLSRFVSVQGWEGAKAIPEVRRLLQGYGHTVRQIDPGFWINPVMEDVANSTQPAVITDVRYRNEADWIRGAGGVLVRIIRPGLDESDTHPSEIELANYPTHFEVVNDASIEHLRERVDELATAFSRHRLELLRSRLAAHGWAYDKVAGQRGEWP